MTSTKKKTSKIAKSAKKTKPAAASKTAKVETTRRPRIGVLIADDHEAQSIVARRVLRPVDEAQEIAVVEVAEAVHLVDRGNRGSDPRHDLRRQLEA